jgi:GTPase
MEEEKKQLKSGIVTLVGRSNVGKSTLLNALVGFKVSITSPLPQTTRRAVQGVLSTAEGQAVFVDTPGLFGKVPDVLTRKINKAVEENLHGVDLILYVVDPKREIGHEERKILGLIKPMQQKKILVINKIDLGKLPFIHDYVYLLEETEFDEHIKISAKTGAHLESLKELIFKHLPVGVELYPAASPAATLDRKTWLAEMIREKVFFHLHKELPYSINVEIETIEERDTNTPRPSVTPLERGDLVGRNKILYIKANLLTTDKKYRGMIVGKGGRMIKDIGTAARKELELVMQQKIFLDLEVVVDPHWPEKF